MLTGRILRNIPVYFTILVSGCNSGPSQDVQLDRDSIEGRELAMHNIALGPDYTVDQWVFDARRGRFVHQFSDTPFIENPYKLIAPRVREDGSVGGILRLHPLTWVRLTNAQIAEPVEHEFEAWPLTRRAECPAYDFGIDATVEHLPTNVASENVLGLRLNTDYSIVADGDQWRMTSLHCWNDQAYVLQGQYPYLSQKDLTELSFAYWNHTRPITYGSEIESIQTEVIIDYYRPNAVNGGDWQHWLTHDRDRAAAEWETMMDNFVLEDGGPTKKPLPVTRYAQSAWIPEHLQHEHYGVFEMQSKPTPYMGELLDVFVTPLHNAFSDPTWHHRIAMPFPTADQVERVTQTLDQIWFEASIYSLARIWESNPEGIFSTYGGIPFRFDISKLREGLLKVASSRAERNTTPPEFFEIDASFSSYAYFDLITTKQTSEISMRFDLAMSDRFSFEIRSLTNRPDAQFQVASKIITYLSQPGTPIAFSATATAMMPPGTLELVTNQISNHIDRVLTDVEADDSVLHRLADLALYEDDPSISPRPQTIIRRLMIPELAWEGHPKLAAYQTEVTQARNAYEAILVDALTKAEVENFGKVGEPKSAEQIRRAQEIIAPLKIALHEWAKLMKLAQRI
jgi:hypothetical protein